MKAIRSTGRSAQLRRLPTTLAGAALRPSRGSQIERVPHARTSGPQACAAARRAIHGQFDAAA